MFPGHAGLGPEPSVHPEACWGCWKGRDYLGNPREHVPYWLAERAARSKNILSINSDPCFKLVGSSLPAFFWGEEGGGGVTAATLSETGDRKSGGLICQFVKMYGDDRDDKTGEPFGRAGDRGKCGLHRSGEVHR